MAIRELLDHSYQEVRRQLLFDLFHPGEGDRPCMVYLHSGSWKSGDKSQFHEYGRYIAKHLGIAVVSMNYTLSSQANYPAPCEDVANALRYLKSHSSSLKLNNKFILCGASAGAHIAASYLARHPSHPISEAILLNGEYDLAELVESDSLVDSIEQFLGPKSLESKQALLAASPLFHLHSAFPKTLLMHGTNDQFVSSRQSQRMATDLSNLGVVSKFIEFEGQRHNWFFDNGVNLEVIALIKRFLNLS